jgi:hypothetical protein
VRLEITEGQRSYSVILLSRCDVVTGSAILDDVVDLVAMQYDPADDMDMPWKIQEEILTREKKKITKANEDYLLKCEREISGHQKLWFLAHNVRKV